MGENREGSTLGDIGLLAIIFGVWLMLYGLISDRLVSGVTKFFAGFTATLLTLLALGYCVDQAAYGGRHEEGIVNSLAFLGALYVIQVIVAFVEHFSNRRNLGI